MRLSAIWRLHLAPGREDDHRKVQFIIIMNVEMESWKVKSACACNSFVAHCNSFTRILIF